MVANSLRVKICGITSPEQASVIAALGANSIGFICVRKSPRYIMPERIAEITSVLPAVVDRVGVFMDQPMDEIVDIVMRSGLTSVQLHGCESVDFCRELRSQLREKITALNVELIKAFRIAGSEDLARTEAYTTVVDWLLLDAYHPTLGGGTGLTLDWTTLKSFTPDRPWLLAGGLTPSNVRGALQTIAPQGIDLSSGVERSPGDKDLEQVALLFENLRIFPSPMGLNLRSPHTIRRQSQRLFDYVQANESSHFTLHLDRLEVVADAVIKLMARDYPHGNIPSLNTLRPSPRSKNFVPNWNSRSFPFFWMPEQVIAGNIRTNAATPGVDRKDSPSRALNCLSKVCCRER
jgi:phosphoribosylanthranilate isomerase